MVNYNSTVQKLGVGIGLRREHFDSLLSNPPSDVDFFEIAPENYLQIGGRNFNKFRQIAERYPILAHGLSLSIGSVDPIDFEFLKQLKKFLNQFKIPWFSEHLCFASVKGAQFHDLIPLTFNEPTLKHVVARAKIVQDFLEMPLALEHVSYYATLGENEMSEAEFVSRVVEAADCALHLDINNVYVNSTNHGYNPYEFLDQMPLHRVIHGHMAGHYQKEKDWLIDTHGAAIIDPVWDLLRYVSQKLEFPAILVERDHNLPPVEEVLTEMRQMREILNVKHSTTYSRKLA